MAKYDDSTSAGRSKVVPFIENEDSKDRHARRLDTNWTNRQKLRDWCESNGWILEIKNRGQHWIFIGHGQRVDWWPSSAKLVINLQYKRGKHVHDHTQVIEILAGLKGE